MMNMPAAPKVISSWSVLLAVLCLWCASCSSAPEIRYYKLAMPEVEPAANAEPSLGSIAIEYLSSDAAYDDTRIVYRKSPYRLDYYYYHRWSAPPSVMITDALRQAFVDSGRFSSVAGGFTSKTELILSGRLVSLEEVDVDEESWEARLVLDLQLHRTSDGALLWSQQIKNKQSVDERNPEGVAKALSEATYALSAQLIQQIEEQLSQAPAPTP